LRSTKRDVISQNDNNPIGRGAETLMIVDIKGLPSKQFQSIKKSIREHAQVEVAKKNILMRAIKKFGK
jgi:ribosomal protein L10